MIENLYFYVHMYLISTHNIYKISTISDIQKKSSELITYVGGSNLTATQATVQKVKKITAHAGVYRTPSKSVPCHLCKLTFKSILDYTNHNLTAHGSNKVTVSEDTGKDDIKKNTAKINV